MTDTRNDLDRYIAACDYPGVLDEVAVTKHLRSYLKALGIKRRVVRLESGWRLEDHPSIQRNIDWILDYMKKQNPDFARVASEASVARDAGDAAFVCESFAKEQRVYEGPYAVAANAARECASRIRSLIQPPAQKENGK